MDRRSFRIGPPTPRIELVVLEIFDYRIARIHQHPVEVPPRFVLVAQIAHSHPPAKGVFLGLVVQVQDGILGDPQDRTYFAIDAQPQDPSIT